MPYNIREKSLESEILSIEPDGQFRKVQGSEKTVHIVKDDNAVDIVFANEFRNRLAVISQIDQNKVVMPGKKRRQSVGEAVLQEQQLLARFGGRKLTYLQTGWIA